MTAGHDFVPSPDGKSDADAVSITITNGYSGDIFVSMKPGRKNSLTVEQAYALIAVESEKSYAGAGRALSRDPSAVRHLIARMTTVIRQGPLVTATETGHVELTTVGKRILPYAKRITYSVDALMNPPSAPTLAAFPAVAVQFARAYEGQQMPIVFADASSEARRDGGDALLVALREARVDIVAAQSGEASDDLVEYPLYDWHLRVLMPPETSEHDRETITLPELSEFQLCVSGPRHLSRRLLEATATQARLALDTRLEIGDQDLMRALVGTIHPLTHKRVVAVMPDDAFGLPHQPLGPVLVTSDAAGGSAGGSGKKAIGGSYSLYHLAGDDRQEALTAVIGQTVNDLIVTHQEWMKLAASSPRAETPDSYPLARLMISDDKITGL